MLVATRNFVAADGSRFFKGRSCIANSHPLAKTHRDFFKQREGTGRGARERVLGLGTATTVAPVPVSRPAPAKPPSWKILASPAGCQFRDRLSSTRIRLDGPAYRRMLSFAEQTKRDGRETGGIAVGAISTSLVEILETHGPTARAIREPNRFVFDVEAMLSLAVKVRDESSGALSPCCIWHTHPSASRDVSTFDLTSLSTWREAFDVPQLVGLIAIPTRSGFDVEAFVVRAGFGKRDICERATVRILQ